MSDPTIRLSGGAGGGAAPGNTVVTEQMFGQMPNAGALGSFSREDHTHGTPPAPAVPFPGGPPVAETSWGQPVEYGLATSFAPSDHSHGSADDDMIYRPAERPVVTWNVPNPIVYTVGPTGTFPDLTTALASALVQNGDTLLVQGSTITEPGSAVNVNKRVKIQGTSLAASVVQFPSGINAGLSITVLGCTVRDLTLRNTGAFIGTESLIRINAAIGENDLLVQNVRLEYYEEALTFGLTCGGGQFKNLVFVYTGPNTNNNYMVRLVGTNFTGLGSRWHFSDWEIQLGLSGSSRTRLLYLTGAGNWAGEILCRRWSIADGGSNGVRSVFLQDNFGMAVGNTFNLLFSDIDARYAGDIGGTLILYPGGASSMQTINSLTVRRCKFKNLSGKGMLAIDGGAPIVPPLTPFPRLYFNENVLTAPAVTAAGWAPAVGPDNGEFGYNTAIFGSHP